MNIEAIARASNVERGTTTAGVEKRPRTLCHALRGSTFSLLLSAAPEARRLFFCPPTSRIHSVWSYIAILPYRYTSTPGTVIFQHWHHMCTCMCMLNEQASSITTRTILISTMLQCYSIWTFVKAFDISAPSNRLGRLKLVLFRVICRC